MRTLIVSDIHGNLEALEAVLSDAADFEAAICLGDIVGYGAQPNECIAAVRALPNLVCLAGNHDLGATGRIDAALFSSGAGRALAWTRHALRPDNTDFLNQLQPSTDLPAIALAHASRRDPVWEYLETIQQAAANFGLFDQEVCLVGHTHVPRTFELGGTRTASNKVSERVEYAQLDLFDGTRRIVNPGSVGQPRDDLLGEFEAEIHPFGADVEQDVARRGNALASRASNANCQVHSSGSISISEFYS